MTAQERFHTHLDECEQCERHPFDLCPVGAELLVAAASDAVPMLKDIQRWQGEVAKG